MYFCSSIRHPSSTEFVGQSVHLVESMSGLTAVFHATWDYTVSSPDEFRITIIKDTAQFREGNTLLDTLGINTPNFELSSCSTLLEVSKLLQRFSSNSANREVIRDAIGRMLSGDFDYIASVDDSPLMQPPRPVKALSPDEEIEELLRLEGELETEVEQLLSIDYTTTPTWGMF